MACQASLSFTISWSLLKLMSIELVMPSNHVILCHPLLLLPSVFSRIFSSESALGIRQQNYWSFSFSISPSNEYSGLISLRIDWFDLLAVQGTLKSLLQHHSSKALILWCSAFCMIQFSHPYMTTRKTIALNSSHWLANCGGQDRIYIPTTRKKTKALATAEHTLVVVNQGGVGFGLEPGARVQDRIREEGNIIDNFMWQLDWVICYPDNCSNIIQCTSVRVRVAAAFSTYDGDLSLPLGLALGSPIFPSGCEGQGKLGVALESLQGLRDLT